jgi:outer membrane lipoprotein carrier protein
VMRGNFVQITKSPYGEEKVQGTVVLKRPGQMRWNFSDGRQFVSDGKTLWIYTPAEKQVLRIANFGEQAATADLVLQSMHKLSELFEVTLVSSDEKAGHVLALAPKAGEQAQFQKLQLGLDAGLVLDKVTLTDAFGTNTVLDFDGLTLGGAAAESDFKFVVPPGVSVVDSGG